MPLTPSFSVQQSSANWTNLVFTDTSTGADAAVTARIIYIQKANGEYLTTENTDFIPWAIADLTKDVNGLITQDYSLLMTVEWLDAMGGVLYTVTNLFYLGIYDSNALYGVVQTAVSNPRVQWDMNYWSNLGVAFCDKQNAAFATEYYQQVKSQAAINRLTWLLAQPIINF